MIVIDTGVRMTTRDGVSLLADVYRPEGPGPAPALLHRTPYDRTDPTLVSAIVADPVRLARSGYAVVVQDVRGRFASEGEMTFFHQERDDGYDAVEWVAAQPWCDGRVGVYGSSYHAMTAYQAVAAQPPHLRAAATLVGATDLRATTRPGGLFELGFLALYGLGQSVEAVRRLGASPAGLLGRIQAAAGAARATVATLPVSAIDVLADQPFWDDWVNGGPGATTLRDDPALVTVPLLQVVAFRDFMAPTMIELFRALPGGGPHALVAGPWAHGGTYTGHVGARTFPGATGGVATWGPLLAAWFDRHLRGREVVHRFLGADPVTYYATGDDRWTPAPSWPPPGSPVVWTLEADGTFDDRPGGSPAGANGAPGPRSVRADPGDPFPTCGGASSGAALGPDGVQDRRAVEARDDVLLWTSPPLAAPLRIAGPVTLRVRLSSSAPDADVCATLVDVEPDGFAAGISEGAVRARTQGGFLAPGEERTLTVALHDTAHTFGAGHRVRLEVAGANFPRLSRNLHTREVPEHGTEWVVAEHTVHAGELELPALDRIAAAPLVRG